MSVSIHFNRIQVPDEIFNVIFEFLPLSDLEQCSRVSSIWNQILHASHVWKFHFTPNVIDDFMPLVNDKVLSWREVREFKAFSRLLAKIEESQYVGGKRWRLEENPQLKNVDLVRLMPKAFVKYGDFKFFINQSEDIKIIWKGEVKGVLKGEKGKILRYLCVDKEALFALQADGLIVHWDYKKKEIVRKIPTSYYKKDPELMKQIEDHFCHHDSFHVENDYIVIKYSSQNSVLEAISCSDLNNRRLIATSGYPKQVVGENLILLNSNGLSMVNLVTREIQQLINNGEHEPTLYDVAMHKSTFCVLKAKHLHLVDKKLNIDSEKLITLGQEPRIIAVVNGLIFGCIGENIDVIHSDGKVKKIITDILGDELKLLHGKKEISSVLLEKLVNAYREFRDSNPIPPKVPLQVKKTPSKNCHGCLIS